MDAAVDSEKVKKIVVHVGPHKTATTYLQKILENNRQALKDAGINYIPLGEIRPLLTSKLGTQGFSGESVREILHPYLDCEILILFDENIIGGLDAPKDGNLYPALSRRLAPLAEFAKDYELSLHMTLRSLPDYLVSRYSESLRHHDFKGFWAYYKTLDFNTLSWRKTVDAVHEAFGVNVNLALFDVAMKNAKAYLDLLIGRSVDLNMDLRMTADVKRSKVSKETQHVLATIARVYSPGVASRIMRALDQEQINEKASPFEPIGPDLLRVLNKAYAEDIQFFQESEYIEMLRVN